MSSVYCCVQVELQMDLFYLNCIFHLTFRCTGDWWRMLLGRHRPVLPRFMPSWVRNEEVRFKRRRKQVPVRQKALLLPRVKAKGLGWTTLSIYCLRCRCHAFHICFKVSNKSNCLPDIGVIFMSGHKFHRHDEPMINQ